MNKFFIASLVLLGACGLSEDKFADSFNEKLCDKLTECNPDAECPEADDGDDADTADCTFDAKIAQECLDAIDAQTCDEETMTPGLDWLDACAEVYDCPEEGGEEEEAAE